MIVLLDNIRSTYNVGSILRTCDALGVKRVYLCGLTPDADNQKVLKTSLGAEKNIKVIYASSTLIVCKKLLKEKYHLISLELNKNSEDINRVKIVEPIALVIGNEISGVSDDILQLSEKIIHIPMKGVKESLNVSVAFGIAAHALLLG
jgi:23S rRNA (guanosine2251-2'-O)-methyltransferase